MIHTDSLRHTSLVVPIMVLLGTYMTSFFFIIFVTKESIPCTVK
nr:MAG TPA: hypothetical protein [Caudoviricetes sp.]